MENIDKEVCLLPLTAELLLCLLDILLQLAHGIFEGRPGIIDLIDDEDVLANQVGHLEGAQVEPLGTGHLGAGDLLGITAAEILVEGQTDGLDGDVGVTGTLEERSIRERMLALWISTAAGLCACAQDSSSGHDIPENAGRNVTTTTDSDHEVRVELLEDGVSRLLAQVVHLVVGDIELLGHFRGRRCMNS